MLPLERKYKKKLVVVADPDKEQKACDNVTLSTYRRNQDRYYMKMISPEEGVF